eukprot:TRINITY_DN64116_c0_g1_i1.p1 TRINITY_DN64116_c0_g1~~TRINITY_DN64116_c0_g1_i1.p1  ORF type:complete len:403 (-),score=71.48 TRINITY_DN64116_c0_g1_i1:135-1343(-)
MENGTSADHACSKSPLSPETAKSQGGQGLSFMKMMSIGSPDGLALSHIGSIASSGMLDEGYREFREETGQSAVLADRLADLEADEAGAAKKDNKKQAGEPRTAASKAPPTASAAKDEAKSVSADKQKEAAPPAEGVGPHGATNGTLTSCLGQGSPPDPRLLEPAATPKFDAVLGDPMENGKIGNDKPPLPTQRALPGQLRGEPKGEQHTILGSPTAYQEAAQQAIHRCTPSSPFWVNPMPGSSNKAREVTSLHHLPVNCLDAASHVSLEEEIEIPEQELMTVQIRTREQRLDWRDFLCEAVAGHKAATLFQLFDVAAEPPMYARPPPSVPRTGPEPAWLANCQAPPEVQCIIAPYGAGLQEAYRDADAASHDATARSSGEGGHEQVMTPVPSRESSVRTFDL